MERASANILLSDFKNLVFQLKKFRPDICLRIRQQGEMWQENFMRLAVLLNARELETDFTGFVLTDEVSNNVLIVKDVTRIIQVEIDKPFLGYQPFFHYTILLFSPQTKD